MVRLHEMDVRENVAGRLADAGGRGPFRHVLACLDRSSGARRVLDQAASIAEIAGARLTAIRVLPVEDDARLADPVDWELSLREENEKLGSLAKSLCTPEGMSTAVVAGRAADCILREAQARGVDLIVLGTGTGSVPGVWGLGGTARTAAETFAGSVMIVPPEAIGDPPDRRFERKILVPLDGSSRAEAVLRTAAAIARDIGAELVLLHAVPEAPQSTDGPPEPEDESLCAQFRTRAEHTARRRMERVRGLLPHDSVRSRIRILTGEEPRRAIMRAVREEDADLLVISDRGLGGDPDLPIGSTAEYLLSRAITPVLLIRSEEARARRPPDAVPRARATVRGAR